jgi:hypothetical protein
VPIDLIFIVEVIMKILMAALGILFILGMLAVILPIMFPTFFFDLIGRFFEWKVGPSKPQPWDDL